MKLFNAARKVTALIAHYACMRFRFRSGLLSNAPAKVLQQSLQACACVNGCASKL